jgi:hypothetical protein
MVKIPPISEVEMDIELDDVVIGRGGGHGLVGVNAARQLRLARVVATKLCFMSSPSRGFAAIVCRFEVR